ncbi:MAG: DUF4179 domain-containing protein [Gudongella sp.]|nr:DUF4179 domain-containing protein [Gudongella sp.]
MSKLDRMLEEKRKEYMNIQAPDSLEEKLNKTLHGKKRKMSLSLSKVAAILLIGTILTYNSSTLAYYGKKIIGYEGVTEGTINELSKMGQGQIIDKDYIFSDGIKVQLDGAMLDGNGMVLFYSIEDTKKSRNIEDVNIQVSPKLAYMNSGWSGVGEIIQDQYIEKWILTTDEAPPFYISTVMLEIAYIKDDGTWENGEIKFKLDRNQAVGDTIKVSIDKKIELLGRTMTIEEISMSPISTIVKGEIQNILSLALDRASEENLMPQNLEMSLYADGKEIIRKGSGMSTDMRGTRFDMRFDTIPKETKEIELVMDSVSVSEEVDKEFPVIEGESIEVLGNTIQIDAIEEMDDRTYITITSDEGTRIPGLRLLADGEYYQLVKTLEDQQETVQDGKFIHTRTLEFEGSGESLKLSIDNIRYTKQYGLTVYKESIE